MEFQRCNQQSAISNQQSAAVTKFLIIVIGLSMAFVSSSYSQLKLDSIGNVRIGDFQGTFDSKLEVKDSATRVKLFSDNFYGTRLWAINQGKAAGFGLINWNDPETKGALFFDTPNLMIDNTQTGNNNVMNFYREGSVISQQEENFISLVSFEKRLGTDDYNRIYYSDKLSSGSSAGFVLDPFPPPLPEIGLNSRGLVLENIQGSTSSGMFFGPHYVSMWSPGNMDGCLIKFYDESSMYNGPVSIITQVGQYMQISDLKFKENVNTLESSLSVVNKLRGVSYNFKSNLQKNDSNKTHFGFIAQELETVLPELVRKDSSGTSLVCYTEVIPILVEAVKELSKELNQVKLQQAQSSSSAQKGSAVQNVNQNSILYQNQPNPFNVKTEIRYNIDNTAGTASINIYNLQGLELKSYTISAKGNGSITVNSSELSAGMYYYTLIVDGVEIDTKKMILTN